MATYTSDIQRRAQAEIDDIVGKHRLPISMDKEPLPYVCTIIKEGLRFAPVTVASW